MKTKTVFFTGHRNLQIREEELPDPVHDEIQVKSIINGICMFDVWSYKNKTFDSPEKFGHEGIGIVTKAGKDIEGVKEGDCVISRRWSEYTNIQKNDIVKLSCAPAQISNYVVEPVSCAVNAVSFLNIYPGERVIIFGAGYMGLLLIQFLRYSPISELVVVDLKDHNLNLASQYGADRVINIKDGGKEQLQDMLENPFDICYEASASADALSWCTKLTKPGGKIGLYSWHHDPRTIDTSSWHVKGLQVLNVAPRIASNQVNYRTFRAADKVMAAGKIRQDELITHRYAFEDIERAMKESAAREGNFIKSVIDF